MTIVTSSFVTLAEAQLRARRLPGLPLVIVDHPVGGLTEAELEIRISQAAPQVAQALAGTGTGGE